MSDQPPQWGGGSSGGGQGFGQGGNDQPPYGGDQPPGGSQPPYGGQPPQGGQPPYGGSGNNFGDSSGGSADNTQSILSLIAGIIVTLCCCGGAFPFGLPSLGLGIAGIVLSVMAMSQRGAGDLAGAAKKQKLAWILIAVGFALGLLTWLVMLILGESGALDGFINTDTSTEIDSEF